MKETRSYATMYFVLLALVTVSSEPLPSEPYLVYSKITNLHIIDLKTWRSINILGGLDRVVPLGIDTKNQHIYFGENVLGKIYRVNYNGSSQELIMENVKNIEGLAIDWIGRKIYLTTYLSETIDVATLDGKFRKVLVNTGLRYPRGIAVDPIAGFLFWTDWGVNAMVERSDLDGSNRVILVSTNITWPNAITVDLNTRRVYWIDAWLDTISSVDYDGMNRKLIFENTGLSISNLHGFDLDITGDSIYFTDWQLNLIIGVNVSTGVIFKNISVPTSLSIKGSMGLRVIDGSKQPDGFSNCSQNNGGCEQLCFHKIPSNISCACQLGMKLADDFKSCKDAFAEEFVMFADLNAQKIYQMQLDSVNVKPIAIPFEKNAKISRPVALEYDRIDDRVYWSDVALLTISRAFRNGTGFEVIFDNVGIVGGLTIDMTARQLYWTSESKNTLETARLDGSFRKTLVKWYLYEPRDIIVDAISGYMYWTDWGKFPRIERAYMTGEKRIDLVNTRLRLPNGLTLDTVYNKLYWVDAYEDNVEVINLITLKRKVILNKKIKIFGYFFDAASEAQHPFGLTHLHDKIYWSDWTTRSIYRADVNTAANIVKMAGDLGKPMDIHAYSVLLKHRQKFFYTFSFPNSGSNFSCFSSTNCPQIDEPPSCPVGYTHVRENVTCGLNCRDIVGYKYRCQCNDWMSCAVRERYLFGCPFGYYSSFRVRECVQDIRPGRCPVLSSPSLGSHQPCTNDEECPGIEKCCASNCTKPLTFDSHACAINNGGCDELCFGVPGGHKCGCKEGYYYNETMANCSVNLRPNVKPPPPPYGGCIPHPAPINGSISCDSDDVFVQQYRRCRFTCNPGYLLIGYKYDTCFNGSWLRSPRSCVVDRRPIFSHCPNSTVIPTDAGQSYATFVWDVPTATDRSGKNISVVIWPSVYNSPVRLPIGLHAIEVTATSDGGRRYCSFNVTVQDVEPPSFICPDNITLYTRNVSGVRLPSDFKLPKATDNAKPPRVTRFGFPSDSLFRVGTTMVKYVAYDDAGLNATCQFNVVVRSQCKDTCGYGGVCRTFGTQEKCECDNFTCGGVQEICGSNGASYLRKCYLLQEQCIKQKQIDVIKSGSCGCGTLGVSTPDFITTSNISCTVDKDNRVTCKITCLDNHHSAIPEFLMLLCYNSKWLRSNKVGKFVELANRNSLPQCYKKTPKFSQSPFCVVGSVLLQSQVCVPCPPGSYHNETSRSCKACEPGTYQDEQGRASCKKCKLPKTSTTTGAESCYFYYGEDVVEMKIAKDSNDWTKEKIKAEIARALTEVCKTQKNCFGSKRRRRRSNENVEFRAENIIVINVDTSDDDIDVEFLVVDPSSSSPVPDKAFSPQKTKDLIENIQKDKVSFTVKNVKIVNKDDSRSSTTSSTKSKTASSSKVPIIVGVVVGVCCIILISVGVYIWKKCCKTKTKIPSVHFTNAVEVNAPNIQPSASLSNHLYETSQDIVQGVRLGFVNEAYNEGNNQNPPPPPYYESPSSLSSNIYEVPNGEPGSLPVKPSKVAPNEEPGPLPLKENLSYGAVVDISSSNNVHKSLKADESVKFFHKRSSSDVDDPSVPKVAFKLEPPPTLSRDKSTTSYLPNVPMKNDEKLHNVANKPDDQIASDVTKEESET